MKNRTELTKYFAELGFKTGAEIGVYRGEYSVELCKNNPGLKLFCIDSWGMAPPGYGEGIAHKRAFKIAQQKLAPYSAILIKKFSMDAVKDFEDEFLDFVYIDASHDYESVRDDINEWAKKVRKGGIVSGHDYITLRRRDPDLGIIKAVDEYISEYNYKLELTGPGTKEDNFAPSWYFIKTCQ